MRDIYASEFWWMSLLNLYLNVKLGVILVKQC